MGRLKTLQSKVEDILAKYPKARDDDRILIGGVYALYYGVDVSGASFKDVLLDKTLPSFESIRRCRQKAQAEYEDLRGSKAREAERIEAQKDFIKYAIEGE